MSEIQNLLDIMARLRDPETGCPWDVEQDFRSIAPYTIEEAYEVADAIERGDLNDLRDELGDLLLQVVFHAQMASEQGSFDFAAVTRSISAKMLRRHPHVFSDQSIGSADEQHGAWEAHKQAERDAKSEGSQGALAGVGQALPALLRAHKLGKRAARVNFDWPDASGALGKISEELDEVADAAATGTHADVEEEIGDLLFAVANLARHYKVNPETALRHANYKFERRFAAVEALVAADGLRPQDCTLEQLEAYWQRVKQG